MGHAPRAAHGAPDNMGEIAERMGIAELSS